MAKRNEVSVVVGDTVRLWGSSGPYRLIVGIGRTGGIVRLYLDGVEQPLVVGARTDLDVEPA